MLQTKYQPNIPSHSREKVDYIGIAIFSIRGHLEFSTTLNFFHFEALKSGYAACEN